MKILFVYCIMVKIYFSYMFYGLVVGILLVGLFSNKTKTMIHYPTPHNVGRIIYKDKENRCFRYNAYRTACSKNNQIIVPSA